MRHLILIITLAFIVTSCKNQEQNDTDTPIVEEQSHQDQNVFQGEFIYSEEAAVLKGDDFIYGVELNDLSKDLANQVSTIKTEEYDMVPVIVKGDLNPRSQGTEGWEKVLTITQIVHVSKTPAKAGIQLKKK